MSEDKYDESLWNEIPNYAFIALGRRGREKIGLDQCFFPECDNEDIDSIHPIKKTVEEEVSEDKNSKKKNIKFLMHCDKCDKNYHLVFSQEIDLTKTEEENPRANIVIEKVSASDENDEENYGHIGFVQTK